MTTSTPLPTWHLLGAGALGCLWAAHLARAAVPVSLLLKDRAQASSFRDIGGILLTENTSTAMPTAPSPLQLPAQLEPDEPVQRLLVCTKANVVESAIDAIAHLLSESATIVLFQNGLGPQQRIAQRFAQHAVYAASTTEGAFRPAPFQVVHAGIGQTWVGPLNPTAKQRGAAPLKTLLELSLRTTFDTTVERRLWQKFAINCAINGLTAIYRCHNGALVDNPEYCETMKKLCTETEQVLQALGHQLESPLFETAVAVARATAANRSSMLQDVEAGRPTEMPYMNGYLCQQAEALDVAVPTHRWLLAMLQQCDRN